MAALGRGVDRDHVALVAPILFTAASEIEALDPGAFAADPTKIVKGITELTRMLGLKAGFTGVPCGMVAEALGAELDQLAWPPRVASRPDHGFTDLDDFSDVWPRSPLLGASIEATRRMAGSGGPMPFLSFEGPAGLRAQLFGDADGSEDAAEFTGRLLAGLIRTAAEAGARGVVLVDLPGTFRPDVSALRTAGNVARFHKMPLFLAIGLDAASTEDLPETVIPCFPAGGGPPSDRIFGTTLPVDLAEPDLLPAGREGCIVTTPGEASTGLTVAQLARVVPALLKGRPQ